MCPGKNLRPSLDPGLPSAPSSAWRLSTQEAPQRGGDQEGRSQSPAALGRGGCPAAIPSFPYSRSPEGHCTPHFPGSPRRQGNESSDPAAGVSPH